jgi:glycosyltransferase involved in cell wall biosynthesis
MKKVDRIGIVVHRWHPSVTGGSEMLAWQYATLLKERFAVDLLTTTATDAVSWKNELPEGLEEHPGIRVLRFRVYAQRSPYWHALHQYLISDVRRLSARGRRYLDYRDGWTMALQREFIAKQGPFSPELLQFLQSEGSSYAALIFITYLYPTTYFGIEAAAAHPNTLLLPTLHDEPSAYLSAYRGMAREVRSILWNSMEERRLAFDLWGPLPGEIVSMAIDCNLACREVSQTPFVLYCGRIDSHKGCQEMFDYFLEFKKLHQSPLQLKLTGVASMAIPQHPDIQFLGFVSQDEKRRLMRNANAFIMPSENESLSIVTLEAMAQETPVLANANGLVVAGHIARSAGGLLYSGKQTFVQGLSALATRPNEAELSMGLGARRYVTSNFDEDVVRERLIRSIMGTEHGNRWPEYRDPGVPKVGNHLD